MKKVFILLSATLGALLLYVNVSGENFRNRIDHSRSSVLESRSASPVILEKFVQMGELPPPVHRYLQRSLGTKTVAPTAVRLKQTGSFRLNEKDEWTPITADHVMSAGQPSFAWHARLQPHPYVWTESQDLFHQGVALSEHRLYSAFPFPMQTGQGKAADISALVRYLAESPWLPAALMPSEYLMWEPIDDHSARAVLRAYGYMVSADFFFGESGDIEQVKTQDRTMNRSGRHEYHPWSATYRQYEQHDGFRVPMEMDMEWSIDGRVFPYAKMRVDSIVFEGI